VGPLCGIAVAWASRWLLRSFITETDARNGLTLIVPFACYLLASGLHASGVLAVVAAGLYLGRSGDDDAGVSDRLGGGAFWNTAELLLTGVAFGLIGLELREVLDEPTGVGTTLWNAAAICGVVLGVRFAAMMTTGPLAARTEPGTDPAAADEVLRQLDLRSAHLI
jgi:monovalent cation/hydrogen antiporter